jgi:aspartate 1-decarboxylase
MLKSKIHHATVTDVDLNYAGSLTVDRILMDAADLLPNELVHVLDVNNGSRFETYVIEGERGSGAMCVNGAAARLVQTADILLVLSYAMLSDDDARSWEPVIVHVDERNRLIQPSIARGTVPQAGLALIRRRCA